MHALTFFMIYVAAQIPAALIANWLCDLPDRSIVRNLKGKDRQRKAGGGFSL